MPPNAEISNPPENFPFAPNKDNVCDNIQLKLRDYKLVGPKISLVKRKTSLLHHFSFPSCSSTVISSLQFLYKNIKIMSYKLVELCENDYSSWLKVITVTNICMIDFIRSETSNLTGINSTIDKILSCHFVIANGGWGLR